MHYVVKLNETAGEFMLTSHFKKNCWYYERQLCFLSVFSIVMIRIIMIIIEFHEQGIKSAFVRILGPYLLASSSLDNNIANDLAALIRSLRKKVLVCGDDL